MENPSTTRTVERVEIPTLQDNTIRNMSGTHPAFSAEPTGFSQGAASSKIWTVGLQGPGFSVIVRSAHGIAPDVSAGGPVPSSSPDKPKDRHV